MIKYAILGLNDVIEMAGLAWTLPAGAVKIDTPLPITDLVRFMFVGGLLIVRPTSPAPVVAGNVVTISGCPLNTVIEVLDLNGKELMTTVTADTADFDETITFSDPGTYEVIVTAPSPYLPSIARVVVA